MKKIKIIGKDIVRNIQNIKSRPVLPAVLLFGLLCNL